MNKLNKNKNKQKKGKGTMSVLKKSRTYTFKNDQKFKKISEESFLAFQKVTNDNKTIDQQLKEFERFFEKENKK